MLSMYSLLHNKGNRVDRVLTLTYLSVLEFNKEQQFIAHDNTTAI